MLPKPIEIWLKKIKKIVLILKLISNFFSSKQFIAKLKGKHQAFWILPMNLKSSPLARAHVKNFMDLPHQSNIALIDWFLLLLWWKASTLVAWKNLSNHHYWGHLEIWKGENLLRKIHWLSSALNRRGCWLINYILMSKKDILSYLRISMQTYGWPHWKIMTYLSYEFGKRH